MKRHETRGFPMLQSSHTSRFLVIWIVLIVLILVTSSCATAPLTSSSSGNRNLGVMFGSSAEHTHVIPHEQALSPSNVAELAQAWITEQAGPFLGSSPIA